MLETERETELVLETVGRVLEPGPELVPGPRPETEPETMLPEADAETEQGNKYSA